MLLFGYIGLTMGLARALSREIDARWVAATAMLPDVIDKPLRYVMAPAFTQGNTRTVGHSLTVMLVGMVVGLLLRRKIRGAGVVALLLPLHLLLDGMWVSDMRVSVLWPWAGNGFSPLHEVGMQGVWNHLGRFGAMAPRSGVYYDTQSEENGWTALGLVSSLLLTSTPPPATLWAQVKRWMFCTADMP